MALISDTYSEDEEASFLVGVAEIRGLTPPLHGQFLWRSLMAEHCWEPGTLLQRQRPPL